MGLAGGRGDLRIDDKGQPAGALIDTEGGNVAAGIDSGTQCERAGRTRWGVVVKHIDVVTRSVRNDAERIIALAEKCLLRCQNAVPANGELGDVRLGAWIDRAIAPVQDIKKASAAQQYGPAGILAPGGDRQSGNG